MKKQTLFLTLFALMLSACSSNNLHVTNQYELPKSYDNNAIEVPKQWWKHFHIDELNALIDESLNNNSDIRMALQKIEQAKLQLEIANSSFFPTLDLSANSASNKKRANNETYSTTQSTNGSVNMKYELDFWGKINASNSMAQASLNMTQYDFETARLTLISTLVETYFQYLATTQRIDLTLLTIQNEEKERNIMQKKYELGSINSLDLSKQKSSLLSYQSSLQTLQLQQQTLKSALAVLVGKSSQELEVEKNSLENIGIPKVSENLSSTVLLNRPDIRSAEEKIQSSNASIHQAYVSMFPSFSLTGQAGQASASLLSLTNPTTTLGLGLGLNLNLFDRGALQNQVKIEQSKAYESVENYKKVVLNALKEVEDSLNSVQSNKTQNEFKEEILEQENKILLLSQRQYEYGLIDFSSLLDAKKSQNQAKEAIVNQKLAYLSSLVTLQKALSGSWVESE